MSNLSEQLQEDMLNYFNASHERTDGYAGEVDLDDLCKIIADRVEAKEGEQAKALRQIGKECKEWFKDDSLPATPEEYKVTYDAISSIWNIAEAALAECYGHSARRIEQTLMRVDVEKVYPRNTRLDAKAEVAQ